MQIEIKDSKKNTLEGIGPLDIFSFPSTSSFFIKVESAGGNDFYSKCIPYVCLNTGTLYKTTALDANVVLIGRLALKP